MKNNLEDMKKFLSKTENYSLAVEAIAVTCASLIASNTDLKTDFIDELLAMDVERRGEKLPDSISYRNLKRDFYRHLRGLVFACFRETIVRDGEILLPKRDENGDPLDDLIPDDIASKYEIKSSDPVKYLDCDYAEVKIRVSGILRELFEKYACVDLSFRVIFDADEWVDYLTFDRAQDLEYYFNKIVIDRGELPDHQDLQFLLSDIKKNPNHHFLTHLLKHTA